MVPVAAFWAGLERIGRAHSAMLSTLEPVVTGAWIVPVGGRLISAAVILLTRRDAEKKPALEAWLAE